MRFCRLTVLRLQANELAIKLRRSAYDMTVVMQTCYLRSLWYSVWHSKGDADQKDPANRRSARHEGIDQSVGTKSACEILTHLWSFGDAGIELDAPVCGSVMFRSKNCWTGLYINVLT